MVPQIKMFLISGMTSLWPNQEQETFEELKNAINGIKQIMEKLKPLIIINAPAHEFSLIKPKGGTNLTHFGHVLIKIQSQERYRDYFLVQHPSLPEKTVCYYYPLKPKRKVSQPMKFKPIDTFF